MAKVKKVTLDKAVAKVKKVAKKQAIKKPSSKWEVAPNYIVQDGVVYEKLFEDGVSVDIDLDTDVLELVKKESRNGKYVSEQDFIRCALREMLLSKGY